jgi:hypothetical protein
VLVTAKENYRMMLRDIIGPALRQHGFKGSAPNWVLVAEDGDRAIVSVQSSAWNSADEVRFYVNLSVVPKPWWSWEQHGSPELEGKTPKEQHGLWRQRLEETQPWMVVDEASAQNCGADVVTQLDNEAIPVLHRLVHRHEMIASIRAGECGEIRGPGYQIYFDRALAILISEEGPSQELDQLVSQLAADEHPYAAARNKEIVAWIRTHTPAAG